MNERCLYRGKRVDNGAWETGFLVIERFGCSDSKHFITDKMTGYHTPIDPATIGQSTGLRDKNGVLVFEGDIYNQGDKNIKYVVVWQDSGLIGKQINSSSYAGLGHWIDRIEVVGNIWELGER